MPSDFLTPFLELDEEFCKVRVSKIIPYFLKRLVVFVLW